ncbi:MAG: ABC transporter permease [Acidobacteriota bacterium]
MKLLETIRVALRALLHNKLRSFLTALGIIIGVAAVIAMVAIGEGAKARVQESFASMGSNLLILMSGSSSMQGMRGGFGSQPTLTWDDLKSIQTELPSVRYAAPSLRTMASLKSEDQNWTTQVTGTTPEYFDIRSWEMARGDRISQSDVDAGSKVVVLGQTVVENLFGASSDPIGQIVRIKNVPFQVIGVMAKKGQSPMGQDYDDAVFVPVSTFQTKVQSGLKKYLNGVVFVGAQSSESVDDASKDVTNLLRDRHRIPPGGEDDFSIRNLTEMASAWSQSTQTLSTLLAAIAAVSLLVGGIGIMNIMLVSVTERTREIGVRMAVGAQPRQILSQFLVEALTLSVMGGAIGVGLGVFGASRLAASFGWPMLVRADIIAITLSVSAAVGIGFGIYPAWKASRLDPIDALRYE